jgi:hypothetical protein
VFRKLRRIVLILDATLLVLTLLLVGGRRDRRSIPGQVAATEEDR